MPYLNWRNDSISPRIRQSSAPHAERGTQLTLGLDPTELRALCAQLDEIFAQGGSELRIDLPRNWILFWKSRESESRLLMAHPQPEEWVATLALEPGHGLRLAARLQALLEAQPGERAVVGELGAPGAVSNLELVIERT